MTASGDSNSPRAGRKETKISTPPIHKSVVVDMSPELAFRRFTTEIASWWPVIGRPLGVSRVGTVVFDEEEGGRVFHRKKDGEAEIWGTVETWDPPDRVQFSFHPEEDPEEAQTVDVSFEPEGDGTRVTLVHSGWDSPGSGGAELREQFETDWEPVLGRFAAQD